MIMKQMQRATLRFFKCIECWEKKQQPKQCENAFGIFIARFGNNTILICSKNSKSQLQQQQLKSAMWWMPLHRNNEGIKMKCHLY